MAKQPKRSAAQRRRTQQWLAGGVVGVLVLGTLGYVAFSARDDVQADGCTEPGPLRTNELAYPAPAAPTERGTLLTLDTNCGDIVIETLPALAPQTVNSMAFLADEGFFDGTACHRLTTAGIFVLQCGDPTATGTGGPGYQLPDENLPQDGAANYPAGTVAMANAGPGTGGSQFFIVYQDTTLPPGYTIWGSVVSGLDIVRDVAAAGTGTGGPDGPPAQPIVIESAYFDG